MPQPATTTKSPDAKAPPARVLSPISKDCIRLAEHRRADWFVVASDSLTVSDLENPALWVLAGQMRRGDCVSVMQSQAYHDLVVADAGAGYVVMKLLTSVELPSRREGGVANLPPGYEVRRVTEKDGPGVASYVAVRLSDGHIYNRDQPHHDFESARAYLLSHASIRVSDNAKLWHQV